MNISTVSSQTNANYEHIIVDDEGLSDLDQVSNVKKLTILKTATKGGALISHLLGIKEAETLGIQDEDVIVHLDGDDWFFHPFVLSNLEREYSQHDCWTTYGNYISTDGDASICREVTSKIDRKTLGNWYFSHLRTFKYKLFKHIREEDFRDDTGNYFKMASDVVMFTPILELCPLNKIKFLPYPSVVYNRFNPFSENKVDMALQHSVVVTLSKRAPYKEL